jgi:AcrR family transcriptional regulator
MPDIPAEPSAARERILVTAHDLFYRHGIRATGVDKVIAASKVTKVTFYRHFPSKNDLIRAYLNFRHQFWMDWFVSTLQRYQAEQSKVQRRREPLAPVLSAIQDWMHDPKFRGCAFINSVAELGGGLDDALSIAAAHKQDMVTAITELLPEPTAAAIARAAALALDGAIVRAQTGGAAIDEALAGLADVFAALSRK